MTAKQPFAICRTTKIKSWSSLTKSVGHNLRTSADKRVHLDDSLSKPLRVLAGSAHWAEELKEHVNGMHLRKLQQGQTHTLAREFFLGMSPEWAKDKTWREIDEWAEANMDWLHERFGGDRVKFAVLHMDEQTPHIAAYVVGLKADLNRKGEPNPRGNGWTLSDAALGLAGNKQALSQLQDEYAEAMKCFDLRRGIKGSKAKHQTTAAWKGMMAEPLTAPIVKPAVEKPTLGDRLDIEAYGKRVADHAARAVFGQMKPYHQQAKAQGKQLREQAKEMQALRALVEQLQPIAEAFKRLLETLLGKKPQLNTLDGINEAQTAIHGMMAALAPEVPAKAPSPVPETKMVQEMAPAKAHRPRRRRAPSPHR
ncbi:MAG: MobV family relaxase [Rhodoferax sp.]